MGTLKNDKVDISRILIHPAKGSGSSARGTSARVSSIEAANSVLESWAHDTSGRLPEECEVEVIFEDGVRYLGHYHLNREEKRISLGRHIRRQLTVMSKTQCVRCDVRPANESVISPDRRDPAECARSVLDHYNI